MNTSLLLQLMATRATGNGNSGIVEMLARVRGMNGGSPVQDPKQLLAQLGSNNPLVSAICKQLAEPPPNEPVHQFVPPSSPTVIDVEPESPKQIANGNGRQSESGEDLAGLQEQIQKLQTEIKTLRDRCGLLASTVGACCLCWGQDPECRACRGRGKPGYAIPDEALFGEFVLPAMRVLRAQKVKPSRPAAPPRTQNSGDSSPQIS